MVVENIAVFDFDWSLIEQDSDYWTIHSLSPEIWQEVCDKRLEIQWTDLMDHALCRLQEAGFTIDDIAAALSNIPFTEEMRNVLMDLKSRNVPVILLSDANTFYIETILNAYNVSDCVTEIVTNPSYKDGQGRLRVQRYISASAPQHNCQNLCSLNICKGKELDQIIERYGGGGSLKKIAYTGDGKNDFCPATRLRKTDAFFMRQEKGLERHFSLVPADKQRICSQFIYWNKPETVWESMPKYFAPSV
ncbi:phosphatase phospho-type [Parasitella parasitica]|nr:phosphatase phospho-type [Parasitella parasitica]